MLSTSRWEPVAHCVLVCRPLWHPALPVYLLKLCVEVDASGILAEDPVARSRQLRAFAGMAGQSPEESIVTRRGDRRNLTSPASCVRNIIWSIIENHDGR